MAERQNFHFKLVLLGNAGVGKSCLVLRFIRNEFFEDNETTIGAAFLTKTLALDDSTVKMEVRGTSRGVAPFARRTRTLTPARAPARPPTPQIWDTAGQERYREKQAARVRAQSVCAADPLCARPPRNSPPLQPFPHTLRRLAGAHVLPRRAGGRGCL